MILLGLGAIAYIAAFIFGIQVLILAFKEHVLWGFAYLFIPFAALVYVIKYWSDTKAPFLRGLVCGIIGIVLVVSGTLLSAPSTQY